MSKLLQAWNWLRGRQGNVESGWLTPLVRDRWMGMTARGWTPDRVELVLRSALAGDHAAQWELFDLMEDTWPRLAKNLGEIKRSVRKMDWTVQPWAEDDEPPTKEAQERAAAISRALWTMAPKADEAENGFLDTVVDLLDAWGKGTVVLEVDWEMRSDRAGQLWAPRATHWVHPKFYGWAPEGWIGLKTQEGGGYDYQAATLERFPDHKFLVGIARAKTGHPLGTALLRPLAWWWVAANFSGEWWLNFAQLFGVPVRWANYAAGAPADTISKIQAMLQGMGSAAWAAFPEGTTLQILDATKGTSGTNPQQALLDHADRLCDILVLGQTLTTDVGNSGSRALGDVHESVRDDIIKAAADWAAEVVTQQLIGSICELTWGSRDLMPELQAEPEQAEDAKANAERDKVLLDAGLEIPKKWFYERHGVPLPAAGEETIGGKKAEPKPQLPPPRVDPVQGKRSTQDLAEAVIESATGVQADWLRGATPWLARLIEGAETMTDDEFDRLLTQTQKNLPDELGPLLNVETLAAAMEANMGAGAVNGALQGWMDRRKRK